MLVKLSRKRIFKPHSRVGEALTKDRKSRAYFLELEVMVCWEDVSVVSPRVICMWFKLGLWGKDRTQIKLAEGGVPHEGSQATWSRHNSLSNL